MARFLDHLSLKGNVRAACARVGLSAEAAYRLRRRDPLFARGWAAALVLARDNSEQVLATRAIDGVEKPVFHRGEQVGSCRQYDTRLLLAHLARLDRAVEADDRALADAGRFDEVLALIAGERFPEELASEDDALPLPREEAADEAVADELERLFEDHGDEDGAVADPAPEDEEDYTIWAAGEAARAAAREQWDGWFAQACAAVDGLVEAGPAEASPEVSRAIAAAARAVIGGEAGERIFTPCTVSTVSTSALAGGLNGPVRGLSLAAHPAFHARKPSGRRG
jgi:hypothetical protein